MGKEGLGGGEGGREADAMTRSCSNPMPLGQLFSESPVLQAVVFLSFFE